MRSRRTWFTVLAIGTILAQACAPSTPPAAAPTTAPAASEKPAAAKPAAPAATTAPAAAAPAKRGGEIVYASIYDPRTLDPAGDDAAFTLQALRQLYDGLVVQDASGKIYPHLADSWTTQDNLTWIFKLRSGVKFHDGTPFNAQAVKYSLERVMDQQKTNSPARARFTAAFKSIEAPDDSTVVITLKELYAPFLAMMATSWAYIVSPTAAEKSGKDFGTNPVGSGAFKYVEWQKQDHLTLQANPEYNWGPPFLKNKGAPLIDRITFRQISELTALGASMETNETHILGFLDVPNMERLVGMGNKSVIVETPSAAWLYYMNVEKPPTNDINVRRAIALAIDNKAAGATPLWREDGLPVQGLLNPAYPFSSQKVIDKYKSDYTFNQDQAKKILDEAGWKVGADGIREKDGQKLMLVDVTNSETPRYVGSAQIVQQQLRAVGIGTDIKALTQATFSQSQARGDHNIAIRTSVGDDPSSIFGTMLNCSAVGVSGQNLSRYCSPEMDKLLADGLKEFDQAKRMAIYEQVQDLAMKELLAVPFLSRRFIYVSRKDVDGVTFDPTPTLFAHDLAITSR